MLILWSVNGHYQGVEFIHAVWLRSDTNWTVKALLILIIINYDHAWDGISIKGTEIVGRIPTEIYSFAPLAFRRRRVPHIMLGNRLLLPFHSHPFSTDFYILLSIIGGPITKRWRNSGSLNGYCPLNYFSQNFLFLTRRRIITISHGCLLLSSTRNIFSACSRCRNCYWGLWNFLFSSDNDFITHRRYWSRPFSWSPIRRSTIFKRGGSFHGWFSHGGRTWCVCSTRTARVGTECHFTRGDGREGIAPLRACDRHVLFICRAGELYGLWWGWGSELKQVNVRIITNYGLEGFLNCPTATHYLLFYLGLCPSYLIDLLSLRLIGAVAARNFVRSSFSHWAFRMTGT